MIILLNIVKEILALASFRYYSIFDGLNIGSAQDNLLNTVFILLYNDKINKDLTINFTNTIKSVTINIDNKTFICDEYYIDYVM